MRFFILVDLIRGSVHGIVEASSLRSLELQYSKDQFAVFGNPEGYQTEAEAKQGLQNASNNPSTVLANIEKTRQERLEQERIQRDQAKFIAQDPIANIDVSSDRVAESDAKPANKAAEPKTEAELVKEQLKSAGTMGGVGKKALEANKEKLGAYEVQRPDTSSGFSRSSVLPSRTSSLSASKPGDSLSRAGNLYAQAKGYSVERTVSNTEATLRIPKTISGASTPRLGTQSVPQAESRAVLNRVFQGQVTKLGYSGSKVEFNGELTDVEPKLLDLIERSTDLILSELTIQTGVQKHPVTSLARSVKRAQGSAESYFDTKSASLVVGDRLADNLESLQKLASGSGRATKASVTGALSGLLELRHEIIHSAVTVGLKLAVERRQASLKIDSSAKQMMEEGLTEFLGRSDIKNFAAKLLTTVGGLSDKSLDTVLDKINPLLDQVEASAFTGKATAEIEGLLNKGASKSLDAVVSALLGLKINERQTMLEVVKDLKLNTEPVGQRSRMAWWGNEFAEQARALEAQQETGEAPAARTRQSRQPRQPRQPREPREPKPKSVKPEEPKQATSNSEKIKKTSAPTANANQTPRAATPRPRVETPPDPAPVPVPRRPTFELQPEVTSKGESILRIGLLGRTVERDRLGELGKTEFIEEKNAIRRNLLSLLEANPDQHVRITSNLQPGFSMVAAEVAADLRREGKNISLDVVLAADGDLQRMYPNSGPLNRAQAVLGQANRVHILYRKGAGPEAARDRTDAVSEFIVQQSDEMLVGGRMPPRTNRAVSGYFRAINLALRYGKKITRVNGLFSFGQPDEDISPFEALNMQRAAVLAGFKPPDVKLYKAFVELHPDKASDTQAFLEFLAKRDNSTAAQQERTDTIARRGGTGQETIAHETQLAELLQEGVNQPRTPGGYRPELQNVKTPVSTFEQITEEGARGFAELADLKATTTTTTTDKVTDITSVTQEKTSTPKARRGLSSFELFADSTNEEIERSVAFSTPKRAIQFLKDVTEVDPFARIENVITTRVEGKNLRSVVNYTYEEGKFYETRYETRAGQTYYEGLPNQGARVEVKAELAEEDVLRRSRADVNSTTVTFIGNDDPRALLRYRQVNPENPDEVLSEGVLRNATDIRQLYGDRSATPRASRAGISRDVLNVEPRSQDPRLNVPQDPRSVAPQATPERTTPAARGLDINASVADLQSLGLRGPKTPGEEFIIYEHKINIGEGGVEAARKQAIELRKSFGLYEKEYSGDSIAPVSKSAIRIYFPTEEKPKQFFKHNEGDNFITVPIAIAKSSLSSKSVEFINPEHYNTFTDSYEGDIAGTRSASFEGVRSAAPVPDLSPPPSPFNNTADPDYDVTESLTDNTAPNKKGWGEDYQDAMKSLRKIEEDRLQSMRDASARQRELFDNSMNPYEGSYLDDSPFSNRARHDENMARRDPNYRRARTERREARRLAREQEEARRSQLRSDAFVNWLGGSEEGRPTFAQWAERTRNELENKTAEISNEDQTRVDARRREQEEYEQERRDALDALYEDEERLRTEANQRQTPDSRVSPEQTNRTDVPGERNVRSLTDLLSNYRESNPDARVVSVNDMLGKPGVRPDQTPDSRVSLEQTDRTGGGERNVRSLTDLLSNYRESNPDARVVSINDMLGKPGVRPDQTPDSRVSPEQIGRVGGEERNVRSLTDLLSNYRESNPDARVVSVNDMLGRANSSQPRSSSYAEDEQERRDAMDALYEDELSRTTNQARQISGGENSEYDDALEALDQSNRDAERTANARNRRRRAQLRRRERSRLDRRQRNETRWEERAVRRALAQERMAQTERGRQGQLSLFDKPELERVTTPEYVGPRRTAAPTTALPDEVAPADTAAATAPSVDYTARTALPGYTKPKARLSDRIEATFEVLGGLVAPSNQSTKHLLGMTTEMVGGLLLGEVLQRSIFRDSVHSDSRELAKSVIGTALTGVLMANPVTAVALNQRLSGQSNDSAAYHALMLGTGIFGSAISKFIIDKTLPERLLHTRTAAGMALGVLSWALAPVVARVFTDFKEVAQQQAAQNYNEQAEMQKALIIKDTVNNLSESAEQEFEAQFLDEEGNEIASDSDEMTVTDLQEVEDASGEPLPFDVNLDRNPFLPGGL